jgi:chromosome segregation protein
MRLKRLELIGFKSFRDKTVLDFSSGISGIVGPNGCGKSNIADAIRWAMGEQRVKTLRGKKMDDVVFNGSEEAPPAGMAEVSMILAADENQFPGDYAETSEVMITRRVFREGESEYSINKIPCRLLDVREFFMGTGIGARTYSLVEQNSIASLVEAKPEERRQFIEEAAGISKYKSRKEIALRKMEATKENIVRVNDIIRELKLQLNSLSRQAKRAQQYKDLKQSLKEAELTVALQSGFALNEELTSQKNEKSVLEDKDAALRTQLLSLEAAKEEVKADVLENEALIANLQERLYASKNGINLKEQALDYSRRKVSDLADKRTRDSQQVELLKGKKDEDVFEIEALRKTLIEVEKSLHALRGEVNEEGKSLEELRLLDKSRRQTIEEKKIQYVDIAAEKARIKNGLSSLAKAIEDLQKRDGAERLEIEAVSRKSENLQRARERIVSGFSEEKSRLAEFYDQQKEISEAVEYARGELTETNERISELREEYSAKSSRLDSITDFAENYKGCNEGIKSLLSKNKHQDKDLPFRGSLLGLVADQIRVPEEYETAVGAVLGEKLQYVLVRDQNDGIHAIDYLKSASLGRGSFAPLEMRTQTRRDSYAQYEHLKDALPLIDVIKVNETCRPVINELLGETLLIANLKDGLAIWSKNGFRGTFVTREGDVISPEGILTGGSVSASERSLLSNRREIEELGAQTVRIKEELSDEQANAKKASSVIAQREEELQRLRSEIHLADLRINGLGKDKERLESEIAASEERLSTLNFNRETIATDLSEAKTRISSHEDEMIFVQRKESDLKEALAVLQEQAEAVNQELGKRDISVTEKKIRLASLEEKYSADEKALSRLEKSSADNKREIESLLGEIERCIQEESSLKLQMEAEEKALAALYAQNGEIAAELTAKRDLLQEKDGILKNREAEVLGAKRTLEGVGRNEAELDVAIRKTEMQMENLQMNMQEKYGMDVISLLPEFKPLSDQQIKEAADRLEKDRRAVENFGEVNLLALSEHEELKKRFDFLNGQIADLNASLEALQRTITKINTVTRQRFAETFAGINRCFGDVFSRLFSGGKAELKMTNEDDLLETGVDIEIHLPGKMTQSITLFSGGEKSLAAIALIFSILIYRPVPFILLDEADAALDDANIARFNALVKETSSHSQILLITHNKKTMEIADNLYGVTVQKKGVSTLVSVSLA